MREETLCDMCCSLSNVSNIKVLKTAIFGAQKIYHCVWSQFCQSSSPFSPGPYSDFFFWSSLAVGGSCWWGKWLDSATKSPASIKKRALKRLRKGGQPQLSKDSAKFMNGKSSLANLTTRRDNQIFMAPEQFQVEFKLNLKLKIWCHLHLTVAPCKSV